MRSVSHSASCRLVDYVVREERRAHHVGDPHRDDAVGFLVRNFDVDAAAQRVGDAIVLLGDRVKSVDTRSSRFRVVLALKSQECAPTRMSEP